MSLKNFSVCLLAALMISTGAQAQVAEPDPAHFPVLEKLKGPAKNLSYDYLGKRMGFDAWLLSGPGVMQIVYTSEHTKGAMLGGALLDEKGDEVSSGLTKNFMQQYPKRAEEILITVRQPVPAAAKPPVKELTEKTDPAAAQKPAGPSPSEVLWSRLAQGGKVTFGPNDDSVPTLYAFLDPAESNTKEIWKNLGGAAKAGKITLHILPLGLTTADSIMEIATILGMKDPAKAWEEHMDGKSHIKETPDTSGVLGMKANVDVAQALNLRKLPFMVYRNGTGKVRILRGVPKNWDDFIKDMTAHP